MTIPKHIIDKALDAWIGDHNCPHPSQIGAYRVLITRSLENVAANIWDDGHEAGFKYGCDIGGDVVWEHERTANPYRASETA